MTAELDRSATSSVAEYPVESCKTLDWIRGSGLGLFPGCMTTIYEMAVD